MSGTENKTEAPHKAGAFDIRNFIALLIGIYGIVLLIAGLIGPSDAQLEKSDGLNINLYAGIGMVVVAALFLLWARLRPVVVADEADEPGRPNGH
ncbi:MAG: hypothetical protein ABIQ59_11320 [Nocardioidaceae bacterium]